MPENAEVEITVHDIHMLLPTAATEEERERALRELGRVSGPPRRTPIDARRNA